MRNKQSYLTSELSSIPGNPGVYLLVDVDLNILYVGKAKNLHRRVSSYFVSKHNNVKTKELVALVHRIQIMIAPSDRDAWLMELMLIQKHRPKYNIRLKDDKSYPYLWLDSKHNFPSFMIIRKKRKTGKHFGPYPHVNAARRIYDFIQKYLKIRNCTPSVYSNRSRPCMQYQIKRCTAPCVGFVSREDYATQIHQALRVLQGQDTKVREDLIDKMEKESAAQEFEKALEYRDLIEDLSQISSSSVSSTQERDCDVIAVAKNQGLIAIHHLMIRKSKVDDAASFIQVLPDISEYDSIDSIIAEYLINQIRHGVFSRHLLINAPREFRHVLKMLIDKLYPNQYELIGKFNAEQKKWMNISRVNAESALHQQSLSLSMKNLQMKYLRAFTQCQEDIYSACIDVSHFQGEAMKASFVVFKNTAPLKSRYRQLSIKKVTSSHDVAAINEATETFIKGWLKDFPSLHVLIIDGGVAQLSSAYQQVSQSCLTVHRLMAISKGVTRKREDETLLEIKSGEVFPLSMESELKILFDYVRDESHRFAVRSHRHRLGQSRSYSSLLTIKGLGVNRARLLLHTFGTLRALSLASVEDIALIKGVSVDMAENILKMLRDDG